MSDSWIPTIDEPARAADQAPVKPEAGSAARGEHAAWACHFFQTGVVDVSVCIVNWNCSDMLRACLRSLFDEPQGVSFEVIVVDNASKDGAADMVAREFPQVRLIRNPDNRGFSRGNNQAALRACGRFLFFLNNDTLIPPGTLRKLVDFAIQHPEVGAIGPRLRDGAGSVQTSWRNKPGLGALLHRTCLLRWTGLLRRAYRRYRRIDVDDKPRPVEILMGAALLVPRQVFDECGGWDESFVFGGEDLELCQRIGAGRQLIYLPDVEITHYGRVSTRKHVGFATTQITVGFARYLRRSGASPAALLLYKLLITLDAPLHIAVKLVEYAWRRLRRRDDADKSLLIVRNLVYFVRRGLGPFWKA